MDTDSDGELRSAPDERRIFERVLEVNQRFLTQVRPVVRRQLQIGQTHRRVADIHRILGKSAEAEEEYVAALAKLERLCRRSPNDPNYVHALAQAKTGWAMLLFTTNRFDQAEIALNESVSLRARLVIDCPAEAYYQQQLACNREDLGDLLARSGRCQDAEVAYKHARDAFRELVRAHPKEAAYAIDLADNLLDHGFRLEHSKHTKDAETAYREAIYHMHKIAEDHPKVCRYRDLLCISYSSLCSLLNEQPGRSFDAAREYGHQLAILTRQLRDHPNSPHYSSETALMQSTVLSLIRDRLRDAQRLDEKAKYSEAKEIYFKAKDVLTQIVSDCPGYASLRHELAISCLRLGSSQHRPGDQEEAVFYNEQRLELQAALAIAEKLLLEYPENAEYQKLHKEIECNLTRSRTRTADRPGC
jgi:tetratricopeptide (TPR) repeat protein